MEYQLCYCSVWYLEPREFSWDIQEDSIRTYQQSGTNKEMRSILEFTALIVIKVWESILFGLEAVTLYLWASVFPLTHVGLRQVHLQCPLQFSKVSNPAASFVSLSSPFCHQQTNSHGTNGLFCWFLLFFTLLTPEESNPKWLLLVSIFFSFLGKLASVVVLWKWF